MNLEDVGGSTKMTHKFKVGDKVRIAHSMINSDENGLIGTVVELSDWMSCSDFYVVVFPEFNNSETAYPQEFNEYGHGAMFMDVDELELVEDVQETFTLSLSGTVTEDGSEVIFGDKVVFNLTDATYKAFSDAEGQDMADGLNLKVTIEHIEPEEPEEVEHRFKVGDKVKIDCDYMFDKGSIGVIKELDPSYCAGYGHIVHVKDSDVNGAGYDKYGAGTAWISDKSLTLVEEHVLFKEGDRVRFIGGDEDDFDRDVENFGVSFFWADDELTEGNVYTVVSVSDSSGVVRLSENEDGYWFNKRQFELVDEFQIGDVVEILWDETPYLRHPDYKSYGTINAVSSTKNMDFTIRDFDDDMPYNLEFKKSWLKKLE